LRKEKTLIPTRNELGVELFKDGVAIHDGKGEKVVLDTGEAFAIFKLLLRTFIYRGNISSATLDYIYHEQAALAPEEQE
jgi:hypothetical protein